MRPKRSVLLFFLCPFLSFSQAFHEEYAFSEDMKVHAFGDQVKLREAPNTDSNTLELIPIGSELEILKVAKEVYDYQGIVSPWYLVNFKGKKGYVVGGLLSLITRQSAKDPETFFLFGLSRKSGRLTVQIRLVKNGKLAQEIAAPVFGNGYFEIVCSDNKGVANLQDIIVIDNYSEACGIDGGKSYIFHSNNKLISIGKTAEIGDGGLFHSNSEFIFPIDEGGKENTIIYKEEHGEMKDEETNWYVTTSQERDLTWDGTKLLPENYWE